MERLQATQWWDASPRETQSVRRQYSRLEGPGPLLPTCSSFIMFAGVRAVVLYILFYRPKQPGPNHIGENVPRIVVDIGRLSWRSGPWVLATVATSGRPRWPLTGPSGTRRSHRCR